MLPHQQADFVRHIAIDIGGSLIKLVYFSPEDTQAESGDASEKGRNHAGGETATLRTMLYGTGSCMHQQLHLGVHPCHCMTILVPGLQLLVAPVQSWMESPPDCTQLARVLGNTAQVVDHPSAKSCC